MDLDVSPDAHVASRQGGPQGAAVVPHRSPAASLQDLLPPRLRGGLVSNIRARWEEGAFEDFGAISLQQLAAAIEHVSTQRRMWNTHKHVLDDGVTIPEQVMSALLSYFNATLGRVRRPWGSSTGGSSRSASRSRSRSHSPLKHAGRADSSSNWRRRSPAPNQQPTSTAPRRSKQRPPGAAH